MAPRRRLVRHCRGAAALEYGLLAALVAVAAIAGLRGLGSGVQTSFNDAAAAEAKKTGGTFNVL